MLISSWNNHSWGTRFVTDGHVQSWRKKLRGLELSLWRAQGQQWGQCLFSCNCDTPDVQENTHVILLMLKCWLLVQRWWHYLVLWYWFHDLWLIHDVIQSTLHYISSYISYLLTTNILSNSLLAPLAQPGHLVRGKGQTLASLTWFGMEQRTGLSHMARTMRNSSSALSGPLNLQAVAHQRTHYSL
jgi:hypothetical protein